MVDNKYTEVIRTAYEKKEMCELFGCKDSYSLDVNGKYYLSRDIRLTGVGPDESDPINMEALISAAEMIYCSLDSKSGERKGFLDTFTNSLIELIESGDIDYLYFAAIIYFIIGNREKKDGFYPLKGICKQIKSKIEKGISEKKDELKSVKKYAGSKQINGLWSVLTIKNNLSDPDVKILGVE